jgi:ferredoxin
VKIAVDRDLCQGHAECTVEAPGVFRVGADNQVEIIPASLDGVDAAAVARAVQYCPTHALRIEEN